MKQKQCWKRIRSDFFYGVKATVVLSVEDKNAREVI